MKAVAILALVALAFVASVSARDYDLNTPTALLYKQWLNDHPQHYREHATRKESFEIFSENVRRVAELNAEHAGKATFSLNEFAIYTPEEFAKRFLSAELPPYLKQSENRAPRVGLNKIRDLPDAFDWRKAEPPVVAPVRNQGSCGSCWAFSTIGNVEGVTAVHGQPLVDLSAQHLVDCDHNCVDFVCDSGCNGGLMENALQYIIDVGGIEAESTYPYKGYDASCKFKKENIVRSIDNFTFIPSDPNQMAHWLVNNGPIAIAADATVWQFYSGGILDKNCGRRLNHGILLVGYDVEGSGSRSTPYWIIKNSWGKNWGMNGYILVGRGNNLCGIEDYPITALLDN